MEPLDVAVAFRMVVSRPSMRDPELCHVSMNREEVNCVPLSVVKMRSLSRLPAGKRFSTACSTAATASSVRQRWERFHHTISRVQKSITLTRYAQPTVGPDQILVISDCQI